MIKKNDIIINQCTDYSYMGFGVVKHDGFCVFVKGLMMNEKAEIQIIAVKKDHGYGIIKKLLTPSKERVESPCIYYPSCGGCQLLHLSYFEQLTFKQNYVKRLLESAFNVKIEPIIGMQTPVAYRNKVQIPLSYDQEEIVGGFYRANTHDIIPIDKCILQSDLANDVYNKALALLNIYRLKDIVKHILIKHAFSRNEIMIVFVINQNNIPNRNEIVNALSKIKEVKSIILNINKDKGNTILGKKEKTIYGKNQILDELMGYEFLISSKSFYQVNSYQTKELYQLAYDMADLSKDDVLLDLYCGVGTIGIIASQYVKKVIGIDIVADAIKDAKQNALTNGVNNIEFYCGDANEVTQELLDKDEHFDVIFVDPPRKGCDKATIDTIIKLNPNKVVYISCNPATLARDLALFAQDGYQAIRARPVDMFPNTYHVECVVLMSKVQK